MGALALPLMIGGTALGAAGAYQRGQQQQKAAEFEAAQLDQAAGLHQAAAQRQAMTEERQAKYAESRAQAVAAASGAGASGRTVTDIIGKIAQEGSYRSAVALFEGDNEAQQMHLRARASRMTGDAEAKAGTINAFSTILGGGGSMFEKYGKRNMSGGDAIAGTPSGSSYLDAGTSFGNPTG